MNTTIYNALGSAVTNNIATTRFYFKTPCNTSCYIAIQNTNPNEIYNYERNGQTSYQGGVADCNIGLINLSDYVYSIQSSIYARTNLFSNYVNNTYTQHSWVGKMMYKNTGTSNTWTIQSYGRVRNSSYPTQFIDQAYYLYGNSSYSSMYHGTTSVTGSYYVFPVFHLKNQGYISKGTGTSSNPYYFSL